MYFDEAFCVNILCRVNFFLMQYIEALTNRQNFTLYFIYALEITVNLVSLKVL